MSYQELENKVVKKTRKPHSCEWCAERIDAGSTAQHRVYVFEGDFKSAYMHLECADAMQEAPEDEVMEGWMPGDYRRGSHECHR